MVIIQVIEFVSGCFMLASLVSFCNIIYLEFKNIF